VQQLAVVLGAVAAYEGVRMLMVPNWAEAFANARRVLDVERVAGFAWEQPLQRLFLGIPDVVLAMNVFYFVGHFLITGIFFFWLYHRSRDAFRVFRNAFLVATGLSVLVHWSFPTAPPRLAGVGLEDTLLIFSGIDIGSPDSSALSNPVAAVPSLHAAYALGVGIGLAVFGGWLALRVAGVLYPPLVVLTIVVTGNHFFLDAIAGVGVLALGFAVAWRLERARGGPEQTGRACPT
jgi:hypothetical protein